ncbi:3-oxoacyl-[acyl-carrier-protein] synthase 3 [Actinomadura rubteroloni]|uniref:Beta-ketoacyl-[acyl-carrier-protein] synthase III n=1 Tax=Actinomadura rubteroloni TaxID=1926885 RepID=A0A2P4UDM7_9ACTN|nr:beta-ketoacyl-ACP synthase 3 [Actinomadura rubteroloni]POM23157.1 3-oxoacyl-[acyl-carrier-protein] synthase 3 [Actinomadura rubteroloni]
MKANAGNGAASTGAAAVLCGVGGHVPGPVLTNADLTARFDTSDEWIVTRTGIRARHVVEPGTATSDLAVRAGAAALASAGDASVDLLLLATTTPDRPCPGTAPTVARGLGLGGVPALDVNAVCSGFVYGLAAAAGFVAAGLARRVLLIGADTFTTLLDPGDRDTATVFGDGAGAVVLRAGRAGEPGALLAFDLGSDGGLADLITVPAGGSRAPLTAGAPVPDDARFTMSGRAVYRHAVQRMTESSRAALDAAGWKPGDVDRFVGHQANLRILTTVADELGIGADRAYANVDRVGNTAAASIPLALADAAAAGTLRPGDRVLLTAFGGGATWGSCALVWPELPHAEPMTACPAP